MTTQKYVSVLGCQTCMCKRGIKEAYLNCYTFNFLRTRGHFCSKFKNKVRTILASAEEQNLIFTI